MIKSRSINFSLLAISLLAVVFIFTSSTQAGELKILDSSGLTRAAKIVYAPATVIVRLNSEAKSIKLSHVDGLAVDQFAKATDVAKQFTFQAVPEGTWKILNEDSKAIVAEVKIVQ